MTTGLLVFLPCGQQQLPKGNDRTFAYYLFLFEGRMVNLIEEVVNETICYLRGLL